MTARKPAAVELCIWCNRAVRMASWSEADDMHLPQPELIHIHSGVPDCDDRQHIAQLVRVAAEAA